MILAYLRVSRQIPLSCRLSMSHPGKMQYRMPLHEVKRGSWLLGTFSNPVQSRSESCGSNSRLAASVVRGASMKPAPQHSPYQLPFCLVLSSTSLAGPIMIRACWFQLIRSWVTNIKQGVASLSTFLFLIKPSHVVRVRASRELTPALLDAAEVVGAKGSARLREARPETTLAAVAEHSR